VPGHPLVAELGQVQAIDAPHERVVERRVLVEVDQLRARRVGGLRHCLVEQRPPRQGDPGAGQPGDPRVGKPEEDHVGAAATQLFDDLEEALDQHAHVEVAAQHVVATRREADQIGAHRERRRHLLGHHAGEEPPPDRQVRIPEVRPGLGRQPGRHEIRPSTVGAARGIRIVHPLGEAVPDRHEVAPIHDRQSRTTPYRRNADAPGQ
jgi:hypothetical protein